MSISSLLTEKLRPKTVEQMMLTNRVRAALGDGVLDQNFLFEGSAGTGKTSMARALAKDKPYIYINCSEERGIDVIREKITDWCSTTSVMDDIDAEKIVILDEIDGAAPAFFDALRATMDKFKTSRFIATCNYINKIPEPIQSRFVVISFNPVSKDEEKEILREYVKRVTAISKKLGIEWDEGAAVEFVKRNFPDFRRILNKIQSFKKQGLEKITLDDIRTLNYSFADVFNMTISKPDPVANYQFLMSNYSDKVDDVLASLGGEYPDWVKDNVADKVAKLPLVIIKVAHYQAQRVDVIQPAISMLACVYEIQQIMNS